MLFRSSQVIEEEGNDAAEVDRRIAEDAARANRLGIQLSGTQSLRTIIGEPPPDAEGDNEQEEAPGQPPGRPSKTAQRAPRKRQ